MKDLSDYLEDVKKSKALKQQSEKPFWEKFYCADCPCKPIKKIEKQRFLSENLHKTLPFLYDLVDDVSRIEDKRTLAKIWLRLRYLQLFVIQAKQGYVNRKDIMRVYRFGAWNESYRKANRLRQLLMKRGLMWQIEKKHWRFTEKMKTLICTIRLKGGRGPIS